MPLLLVRHGIALDWDEHSGPDSSRPLTPKGVTRTEAAARGLATLVPPVGLVASSPYVRARETAEILARACGDPELVELSGLTPGDDPRKTLYQLDRLFRDHTGLPGRGATLAVVGHEPHLSGLFALLLAGRDSLPFRFKKAGAALFELPARGLEPGSAELLWAVTPKVLRGVS